VRSVLALVVTLIATAANGKQKQRATRTAELATDALAAFLSRRLEEPRKRHGRVRIKVRGGKVRNSIVLAMASATPE